MAWYFNFCAPHLPNDSTINFHRYVQTGCLLAFLTIYVIIHLYYKLYGPDPQEEKQRQKEDKEVKSGGSDGDSQNEKGSEENSENNHQDDKSISIAGGLQQDENSSIGPLDKSRLKTTTKKLNNSKTQQPQTTKPMSLSQLQSYFPIVFGHFSIACALTIMYSPYAEQSLAILLYIIFALVLVFVNSRRKIKTTRVIWGIMCLVVCFLVMSGLLEVGQANYNKMENQCFSVGYQALY